MTTLSLSIPEDLRELLVQQVRRGGYASASDYIETLLREEQKRIARAELEAKLLARLDDSDSVEADAADFRQMREEFQRRVGRTSANGSGTNNARAGGSA